MNQRELRWRSANAECQHCKSCRRKNYLSCRHLFIQALPHKKETGHYLRHTAQYDLFSLPKENINVNKNCGPTEHLSEIHAQSHKIPRCMWDPALKRSCCLPRSSYEHNSGPPDLETLKSLKIWVLPLNNWLKGKLKRLTVICNAIYCLVNDDF